MNEEWTSAREDLSIIKTVLEQTMTGLRELAGFFTAYGWIWLGYGLAITVENAVMSALYVTGTPEYRLGYYSTLLSGPLLLFLFGGMGLTFIRWRRRARREGLNALARKLLDVWGVCLAVFVCVSLGSDVVGALRGYYIKLPGTMAPASMYVSAVLRFLFPVLPLLLTAVFAENKGMLILGLAAFAFDLLRMAMPFDWLSFGVTRMNQLVWQVPRSVVLWGMNGFLLLAFGYLLKRDKKHGAA